MNIIHSIHQQQLNFWMQRVRSSHCEGIECKFTGCHLPPLGSEVFHMILITKLNYYHVASWANDRNGISPFPTSTRGRIYRPNRLSSLTLIHELKNFIEACECRHLMFVKCGTKCFSVGSRDLLILHLLIG